MNPPKTKATATAATPEPFETPSPCPAGARRAHRRSASASSASRCASSLSTGFAQGEATVQELTEAVGPRSRTSPSTSACSSTPASSRAARRATAVRYSDRRRRRCSSSARPVCGSVQRQVDELERDPRRRSGDDRPSARSAGSAAGPPTHFRAVAGRLGRRRRRARRPRAAGRDGAVGRRLGGHRLAVGAGARADRPQLRRPVELRPDGRRPLARPRPSATRAFRAASTASSASCAPTARSRRSSLPRAGRRRSRATATPRSSRPARRATRTTMVARRRPAEGRAAALPAATTCRSA